MNPLRSSLLRPWLHQAIVAYMIATIALPVRVVAGQQGDCCEDDSSCDTGLLCIDGVCEGENRFNVISGNARRRITDMRVLGAAVDALVWRRYHNTVRCEGAHLLGGAGDWRHNWQYELFETVGKSNFVLIYPYGNKVVFAAMAGNSWTTSSARREQIVVSNDGVAITTADGTRMQFARRENGGGVRYEMVCLIDGHGLVTALDYDVQGRLRCVTEPAGRSLIVQYSALPSAQSAVISQVTGSDGRSVAYDYEMVVDPASGQQHVALKRARYGDGAQAVYSYAFVRAASPPLLVQADDPRYDGTAKSIKYTYNEPFGMIRDEVNPATGGIYSRLEWDQSQPNRRVVQYSDLRQIVFQLTADGQAVASRTDSLGRVTWFERDAFGRVTTKTDHQRRRTEIAYSTAGLVASEQRAGRSERQLTYDAAGLVAQATDRHGRVTRFARDSSGRVARESLPDGTAREFAYDAFGRIVRQRERDGAIHQFTYNARGLKTAWIDPTGQAYRYTHDDLGREISVTDPLGRTTRREFNDLDLPTKIVLPDGAVLHFTYDAYGRKITETDRYGRIAEYAYDNLSRTIQRKDFTGGITTYDYTELPHGCGSCTLSHRPTRIVAPDGTVTAFLYDSEGRLLAKTVALGTAEQATTTYAYDSDDNLVSVSDPLGKVTRFTYDDDGHRLTATDPLGRVTKWTYDERGNVLTVTAPEGAVTKHAFDDNDRRIATTDANGATTRFTYDEAGRQTSLTDANGNAYRFTYDAAGRKTAMIYPDDTRERWTYDAAGQQATYTTRAGQVKTSSYDSAGRIAVEKWTPTSAAPDVTYAYDSAGRLTSLSNGLSTLRNTYDSVGRMASETTDLSALLPGASPRTVGYAYDVMGRRTAITYPDGTLVKQTYNALGRLASVSAGSEMPIATWGYDANGRMATIARANGVGTAYTYDAAGQLTEVAHKKGADVLALARYTLDAAGRRTSQTREDGITETYAYDPTGQLTAVDYGTTPARKEAFTYDPLGNRTTTTDSLPPNASGPVSTDYKTNNLNQYTEIVTRASSRLTPETSRLTYDLNGNLTFDGKQTYRYDAQNRLISVESSTSPQSLTSSSSSSAVRAEFFYDARNRCVLRRFYGAGSQGQWIEKTDQSHALTYSDWNLIDERRPDGTLAARYTHGARIDEIVQAFLLSSGIANVTLPVTRLTSFFPLIDGLSNTVAMTDARGAIVSRFRFDAYGLTQALMTSLGSRVSASSYRFLFNSRDSLQELTLNDHRNRYLTMAAGRWLTPDPITFYGRDLNLYRYVGNIPLMATDPFGLLDPGGTVTIFLAGTSNPSTATVVSAAGLVLVAGYGYYQLGELIGDIWTAEPASAPSTRPPCVLYNYGPMSNNPCRLICVYMCRISDNEERWYSLPGGVPAIEGCPSTVDNPY